MESKKKSHLEKILQLIIQLVLCCNQKANEVMAYSYSKLYKIETIGLRFLTVYGPWGDLIWFV